MRKARVCRTTNSNWSGRKPPSPRSAPPMPSRKPARRIVRHRPSLSVSRLPCPPGRKVRYRAISATTTIVFSTTGLPPRVRGSIPPNTATSGVRRFTFRTTTGVPTPSATGFTATAVGPGVPTNHSAGPPITMVAGYCCATPAGAGFPETNGLRPGLLGKAAAITWAGPRCLRKHCIGMPRTGAATMERPAASARALSASSAPMASVDRSTRWCFQSTIV